jgi:hypothetical protein
MKTHNTIYDTDFQILPADLEFDYQQKLTSKLDNTTSMFNQEIINEIVLWKVNRYANVNRNTLKLINDIDAEATDLDVEKTKIILNALIQNKGIQLPMASTILRFRNKNIYQIIDQRVYRIIYKDKKLKLKTHLNEKNLDDQVELYIQFLKDLKEVCKGINIPFDKSDRILFMADRRINNEHKLDNY